MHEFPCGNLPLDFAGTLRARRREEPLDLLSEAGLLDAWLLESGLRHEGPRASAEDFSRAIELREAIFAAAWSRLHQQAVPGSALETLHRLAAAQPLNLQLGDRAGFVRSGSVEQALADLARQSVELFGGDNMALLRECGQSECTQIYLDHSRGRRREWCSMQSCGSRAKAAAYRARKKSEQIPAG